MRSWESSDSDWEEGLRRVDIVFARSGKSSARGLEGGESSSSSEGSSIKEGGLEL
jgi:hypothetical protein